MKMKVAFASALLGLSALAGSAQAQTYVSGAVGLTMPNTVKSGNSAIGFENSVGLNAAVGYAFSNGFRLEGELAYYRSGVDEFRVGPSTTAVSGLDVDVFTGAVNAFYDIKTGTSFTPYLGGGIGYAHSKLDGAGSSNDFLWQLEAGISVALTDRLALVPAYRYARLNAAEGGSEDLTANIVKLGLRYSF